MADEWENLDSDHRLPPCGGSGLKCHHRLYGQTQSLVSLHAEGVD